MRWGGSVISSECFQHLGGLEAKRSVRTTGVTRQALFDDPHGGVVISSVWTARRRTPRSSQWWASLPGEPSGRAGSIAAHTFVLGRRRCSTCTHARRTSRLTRASLGSQLGPVLDAKVIHHRPRAGSLSAVFLLATRSSSRRARARRSWGAHADAARKTHGASALGDVASLRHHMRWGHRRQWRADLSEQSRARGICAMSKRFPRMARPRRLARFLRDRSGSMRGDQSLGTRPRGAAMTTGNGEFP